MMTALGTAGAFALAGCSGDGSDGGTPTTDGTPTESTSVSLPTEDDGIEEWGQRLNRTAREDSGVDFTQFEGEDITLTFGMGDHPYSTTTRKVKPYFEELTGITVEYKSFSEDQFWLEAEQALSNREGEFDGIMNGLWPAGGYHALGSVRDLKPLINDASLTDKEWLHMEDFRPDTKRLMTFPKAEDEPNVSVSGIDLPEGDFTGFANGIEAYGCVGYHKPTYEQLGLSEPTNFEELEENARQISESDETDQQGIVSRTSSTTLSSANFGTMFRSHGAKWIDRREKVATLNSEEGVAALERFGRMLNNYGPRSPSTYDWYANNEAYNQGRVGMIYSTPQTSGIIGPDRMSETKWLPPLQGPGGQEPVVDTWIWSTGISEFSQNPEAAWLYIQWANSREANYMLSTRQWQGDAPRAGYARWDYIFERNRNDPDTPEPPEGYETAFREGMNNVPSPADDPARPPPVPVDTPKNMDIMSEVALAMSSVVAGQTDAKSALDNAAPKVTEHAKQIPDRYVAYLP